MRIPPLKATSSEILHLDFLRFVASIGIVFHHSHQFFYDHNTRASIGEQTKGFALFVDLFFVISGYVICHVYKEKLPTTGDFLNFMQRRIGRLFPLHLLTLFLSIFLYWLFLKVGAVPSLAPQFRADCIIDTALLMHAAIPYGNGVYFNGVTWSISAEMFMYLAFPLFLFLATKRKTLPMIVGFCIIGAIVMHAASSGSLLTYQWADQNAVLRALPSFMIGVGVCYQKHLLRFILAASSLLALALIGLFICMLNGAPTLLTLAFVYLTAIFAIAADAKLATSAFITKMAPLGQLTYSIYMWHGIFILVFINAIGDKLLHGAKLPMLVLALLCYCGIFVTSYLSFFYIETPARRWVDRLSIIKPKAPINHGA